MAKKPQTEDAQLDMTPMIDVVFQLIIFFVVTLKMSAEQDETIVLEDGKHGIELTTEELPPSHLMIDVSRTGRITINDYPKGGRGYADNIGLLTQKVKERVTRYGADNVPILIRGDIDARHEYVKKAMDACTAAGVWKLSFVAVQEPKGPNWQKLYDQVQGGKRRKTPWVGQQIERHKKSGAIKPSKK